jgi:hypothetical protein
MIPVTMIAMRSETDVATPRFCSTRRSPTPSFATSRRVPMRFSTTIGASPSDGSSMTSRRGLSRSARPIASICCSPPDSWVAPFFLRAASDGNRS